MLIPKDILKQASGARNLPSGSYVHGSYLNRVVEAVCDVVNLEMAELKRRIVLLERELYAQN